MWVESCVFLKILWSEMFTKSLECKCIVKVGQLKRHRHFPYGINQSICKIATAPHASSESVTKRKIYFIITVSFHLLWLSDTCFDKMSPTTWLADNHKRNRTTASSWLYSLSYNTHCTVYILWLLCPRNEMHPIARLWGWDMGPILLVESLDIIPCRQGVAWNIAFYWFAIYRVSIVLP